MGCTRDRNRVSRLSQVAGLRDGDLFAFAISRTYADAVMFEAVCEYVWKTG